MPCLRRMISASARLPLASTKAFLHSIIPAPVRSRSSFTSFALISMFFGYSVVRLFGYSVGRLVFHHCLARQGHGRQVFVGEPLRHELIQLLRIELGVFGDLFGRSLVGDDLFGREIVLGSQQSAFD